MSKVTVYNRLQQPITIGEDIIAANGSMEFEHSNKDLKRLEERGHISIIREKSTDSASSASPATQNASTIEATSSAGAPTSEQAAVKGSYTGKVKGEK